MSINQMCELYTINLGVNDDVLLQFESYAAELELFTVTLDLREIYNYKQLFDYLVSVFEFPHAVESLDAVIDMISDLEWLGQKKGYLVNIQSTEQPSGIVIEFMSLFTAIIDRCRTAEKPFIATIQISSQTLKDALDKSNAQLEAARKLAWAIPGTGPVTVIVQ